MRIVHVIDFELSEKVLNKTQVKTEKKKKETL